MDGLFCSPSQHVLHKWALGAFKARVRCPKFVPWVASCLGGRLLPQNGTPNTESGAISLFDCILMHIAHDRLLLPPIMPIPK